MDNQGSGLPVARPLDADVYAPPSLLQTSVWVTLLGAVCALIGSGFLLFCLLANHGDRVPFIDGLPWLLVGAVVPAALAVYLFVAGVRGQQRVLAGPVVNLVFAVANSAFVIWLCAVRPPG